MSDSESSSLASSNGQNVQPNSSNPLAQFAHAKSKIKKIAPKSSNGGGWMSTKKSGKEVLKSKKEAENSIRARKGLQVRSCKRSDEL